jgi:hypothetical protein
LIAARFRWDHPLSAFLRLIRLAKITALIAQVWTIIYVALIFGWQITTFVRVGAWPSLPLSSVVSRGNLHPGEIFATASVAKVENNELSVIDGLLRIPTVIPLLVVVLFLGAFHIWLQNTEKRYLAKQQ